MNEHTGHPDRLRKQTPDAYTVLSWKDTTSLCEFDTFDEYLKAECKQLLCVNQTLKNKVRTQETSIEYLMKTLEERDQELETLGALERKEFTARTTKKSSNQLNQLAHTMNPGYLCKSINQEFIEGPSFMSLVDENKRLLERVTSQESEITNLKSHNSEIKKELELTEHEVSNLKQKLFEQSTLTNTIEKLSRSIEQKSVDPELRSDLRGKGKHLDSCGLDQLESLRHELKEKSLILNTLTKEYKDLQFTVQGFQKTVEEESKRNQFLSKNLIQLSTQHREEKRLLQQNIFQLYSQMEKEENMLNLLSKSGVDRPGIKIIESCESEPSEFEGFSRADKRVGSIKNRSLRENEKSEVKRLIDRYYRIKANNF